MPSAEAPLCDIGVETPMQLPSLAPQLKVPPWARPGSTCGRDTKSGESGLAALLAVPCIGSACACGKNCQHDQPDPAQSGLLSLIIPRCSRFTAVVLPDTRTEIVAIQTFSLAIGGEGDYI